MYLGTNPEVYYHVALQTPAKQIYQLMTFLKLFLIFIAPQGSSEVEKDSIIRFPSSH